MSAVLSTAHLVDYVYVQGDTVKVNFCFQDKNGNPIPVDAWAWEFALKACNGTALPGSGQAATIAFPQSNELAVTVLAPVAESSGFDGSSYLLSATVAGVKRTYIFGKFKRQKV